MLSVHDPDKSVKDRNNTRTLTDYDRLDSAFCVLRPSRVPLRAIQPLREGGDSRSDNST